MASLNVQALARRNPKLMACIKADPGQVFVSVDLSSGEPTCTAHYSKDKNYYDAAFGMVGKDPYYDGDVLKISDIYLTVLSVSPMGQAAMRKVFEASYDGRTFSEVWREDPDYITKKILKKERALHKTLTLGLGYSMGPKKLVRSAYDGGHDLPLKVAKAFFKAHWDLFNGVAQLGRALQSEYKARGFLVNDFGYRLVPDADYKCLNYFIQSTVSGIMNVLSEKFFTAAPYCQFVTVIHDELIFECPADRQDEARKAMDVACDSLNDDLGWDVRVRTGWAVGADFYEAK